VKCGTHEKDTVAIVKHQSNLDVKTVTGFGDEWTRFDQKGLAEREREELFDRYFRIFP
jgi:hypothetical protein